MQVTPGAWMSCHSCCNAPLHFLTPLISNEIPINVKTSPRWWLCWLIYRPVRPCTLPPRHMFLGPVLFSSGLPYPSVVHDGAWWCSSSWGSGCLVPWLPGPGGQARRVGGRLQSPREVLLLQVCPQKTFLRSHIFHPQLCAVDPFASTLHEVSHVSREEILERPGGSDSLSNLSKLRIAALGAIILA